MKKALFLDRDGVINVDLGYVHKIESCQFIDGIFDLTRMAMLENFSIFIVTNQAGIGRGYYTEHEFDEFMAWMSAQFQNKGVIIQKVYFSPYHPNHGLGKYKRNDFSRKPNPGMLLEAIEDFNLDVKSSVLIGDKMSDIQAGIAAGVGTNLYLSDGGCSLDMIAGCYRIDRLADAAQFLRGLNT